MTLRRLWLVAVLPALSVLLASSCRRPPPELPPATPVDAGAIQTRLDELARTAESVRRYQGFVRIRGKGPEGGFSGRLVVVFERPDHLRVDLLGAFGSTRWSAAADSGGITVVFPGPKQYVREEDTSDVVGRLLGVRLSTHEVMALLSGIGAPTRGADGEALEVLEATQRGVTTFARLDGSLLVELDEDSHISLVQTSGYRVSYPTPWMRRGRHIPDTIQLETDTMRATLTPEDVDVNVALASEAFVLEIPDGAERLRPSDVVGEAVFVVTKESP